MPDAKPAATTTTTETAPPPVVVASEGGSKTALTPAAGEPKTALTSEPDTGEQGGAQGAGSTSAPKDSKADEAKTAAGKPDEPKVEDIDIKLPEGVEADLSKFKTEAKAAGLKAEQAQKFVDLYAEGMNLQQLKREAANKALHEGWIQAYKTDPEIGGAKLKESLQFATRAVAKFVSPAGIDFLAKTGLGDNPELIRAFSRIGKAIAEDKSSVTRAGELPPKPSREEALSRLYDVHDQRRPQK